MAHLEVRDDLIILLSNMQEIYEDDYREKRVTYTHSTQVMLKVEYKVLTNIFPSEAC